MVINPVGAYLQKRWNNKIVLFLASAIGIISVIAATFMPTFATFTLFYGIIFPGSIGLGYFTPLMVGWEWLPQQKGLVTGMILCGFGFASFIYGFIAEALVNPHNVAPVEVPNGDKIYDISIA